MSAKCPMMHAASPAALASGCPYASSHPQSCGCGNCCRKKKPGYTQEDEALFDEIDARDKAREFQFIPARPATAGVCPNILQFEPQIDPLPKGDVAINGQIPWAAINLPWALNQYSQPVNDPENPDPENPNPIYSNLQTISDKFYEKRNSVPEKLIFYGGLSLEANSPLNTIFLKNFEERGFQNDLHFKYKYALSSDKMPFYAEKINNFVNKLHTAFTSNAQPVLSTFKRELVLFFLDIHLGAVDHPDFVFEYFDNFLTITALISNPPFEDYLREIFLVGKNMVPKVREYFLERIIAIQNQQDKSTFVFWWTLAGLPGESLVTEALHNIVAFSQFTNTIFKLATSQVWAKAYAAALAGEQPDFDVQSPPEWIPASPIPFFPPPPSPLAGLIGPVDLLQKGLEIEQNDQLSDEDKKKEFLNLAREFFRILSPNTNSFSKLGGVQTDNNDDPLPDNVQVRHLWVPIMIQNQPDYVEGDNEGTVLYNRLLELGVPAPGVEATITQLVQGLAPAVNGEQAAFKILNFFIYNPDAYNAQWRTFIGQNVTPPDDFGVSDLVIPQEDTFKFSPVDSRGADGKAYTEPGSLEVAGDGSIVERDNDKLMVIPEKPLFLGFGLGFRRCPGEVFNYLIFIALVKRFDKEEFFFAEDNEPCVPGTQPERWIPVAARDVRRDNLFVKQPANFYNSQ